MKNLITDVFLLDKIQVINEGKNGSTMKIRGVFQRANEANANKRIYSKTILENSIKALKPMIENRMLVGELDHPEANNVRLSNASHLITNLKMVGNEMIGEAEILNTPAGKIAQTLINDNVKIGISSRGTGTISEDKEGVKHVNEDFKLVTFDLVADPSTRGAFPGLAESKLDMDQVIKKTFGEKVLIALLKENLNASEPQLGSKPEDKTKKPEPEVKKKNSYWASRKEREKRSPQNYKSGYTGNDLSNYTEQEVNELKEDIKRRILDMSVVSEGSSGSAKIKRAIVANIKRANAAKTTKERRPYMNKDATELQPRLDYKAKSSLARGGGEEVNGVKTLNVTKMNRPKDREEKKIRSHGDQPEMYESFLDLHESLKQRILDMSRSSSVDEGSANWGRTLRVRDAMRKKLKLAGAKKDTVEPSVNRATGEKFYQKLKASNDRHDKRPDGGSQE